MVTDDTRIIAVSLDVFFSGGRHRSGIVLQNLIFAPALKAQFLLYGATVKMATEACS